MLQIAQDRLKQEEIDRVTERDNYMEEHCPTLCLPSDVQGLQVRAVGGGLLRSTNKYLLFVIFSFDHIYSIFTPSDMIKKELN